MDSTNYSSPFLCSISDAIRVRHYSRKTEKAYIGWVKRFIYFHNKQHPREMGAREVTAFLTHLAVDRNVAPSTQNQAFNALMFLYRVVLDQPIEGLKGVARAKTRQKIPVVLTREEVQAILQGLDNEKRHPSNKSLAQTHPPKNMCKNMIRNFWFFWARKNWEISDKHADFLSPDNRKSSPSTQAT